jgi:hypothetical protein
MVLSANPAPTLCKTPTAKMERAKMSSVSDQSIYFAEFKMSRI